MYGEGNSVSTVAAPVVSGGTVAMLPATGANFLTTIAIALALGLIVWGLGYLIQSKTVKE